MDEHSTDPDNGNDSHWKLGIFYFNPKDKRPFPKRNGSGWGVNWANPYAVVFMLVIIVACIADAIYQIKFK